MTVSPHVDFEMTGGPVAFLSNSAHGPPGPHPVADAEKSQGRQGKDWVKKDAALTN
jgi:hypothetical protein